MNKSEAWEGCNLEITCPKSCYVSLWEKWVKTIVTSNYLKGKQWIKSNKFEDKNGKGTMIYTRDGNI